MSKRNGKRSRSFLRLLLHDPFLAENYENQEHLTNRLKKYFQEILLILPSSKNNSAKTPRFRASITTPRYFSRQRF